MTRRTEHLGADLGGFALKLANRGSTSEDIETTLMREPGILRLQEDQGPVKARSKARAIAKWAVAYVVAHPASDVRKDAPVKVVQYRDAADALPWPAHYGPADRKVLEAFYIAAERAISLLIGISARDLGIRTGMNFRKASEAVTRLCRDHHALVRQKTFQGPKAAVYLLRHPYDQDTLDRLRHPDDQESLTSAGGTVEPPPPKGSTVPPRTTDLTPSLVMSHADVMLNRQLLMHDAFRPAGLGHLGWLVLRWLDEGDGVEVGDLVQVLGQTTKRVEKTLHALDESGVAFTEDGAWRRIDDGSLLRALDDYAIEVGVLGTRSREQWLHMEQRDERAQWFGWAAEEPLPDALIIPFRRSGTW